VIFWRLSLIVAASLGPSAIAQAQPGNEQDSPVAASRLVTTSAGTQVAGAPSPPNAPVITIGRDQDIVGTPVSISALMRPPTSLDKAKGGITLRGGIPRGFPLRSGVLTSSFGRRSHPILGTMRGHSGVDLAAPTGSPVYATGPGMVVSAGWNGGYGLYVEIEHGGTQSRYGHLSALAVSAGQMVPTGMVIGYVGATGQATGPHLHYEIRIGGAAVDPTRAAR
jgi:murein DD-endopeptidase MepM/ murein hydrolase activator NlpD